MTNRYYITTLTNRELAKLLIQTEVDDFDDEDYMALTHYITSDGTHFLEFDYEDVLDYEVWWLEQEKTDE